MRKATRYALDNVNTVLLAVGAIAILAMMLQTVSDALLRTFLNRTVPGTNEFVSFYYMVAVTFLPLAYVQKIRGHVFVELFTSNLGRQATGAVDAGVFFTGALGMGYFCWAATWKALRMTAINEFTIGQIVLVTWPSRWLVVLGTGLMGLYLLLNAIDELLVALGRPEPVSSESALEKLLQD